MTVSGNRSMTSRFLRVLPALALATLLVGCGGGSKGPSTSTATSTPKATVSVVARAEAICHRKAAPPHAVPLPTFAEVAAARDRTAHELAALKASGSLATGYRQLASLIAEEASLYRRLGQLSREDNNAGALAIDRQLRRHPAAKQALLVGLANCA
jgi:hypothetical protein